MAHIQIGSLAMNGGIRCVDWSDLFASPPKRGSNRVIAGEAGRLTRARVIDELRAGLLIQVYGFKQLNGTAFSGDPHENMYTLFNSLRAVADNTEVQTLQVIGESISVDCIVEELTSPTFLSHHVASCVLDVTLPDGPVDLSGGS